MPQCRHVRLRRKLRAPYGVRGVEEMRCTCTSDAQTLERTPSMYCAAVAQALDATHAPTRQAEETQRIPWSFQTTGRSRRPTLDPQVRRHNHQQDCNDADANARLRRVSGHRHARPGRSSPLHATSARSLHFRESAKTLHTRRTVPMSGRALRRQGARSRACSAPSRHVMVYGPLHRFVRRRYPPQRR